MNRGYLRNQKPSLRDSQRENKGYSTTLGELYDMWLELIGKQPTIDEMRIPCKLDDMVFGILKCFEEDGEEVVPLRAVGIFESGRIVYDEEKIPYIFHVCAENDEIQMRYSFDDFGKIVFTNREMAEKVFHGNHRENEQDYIR